MDWRQDRNRVQWVVNGLLSDGKQARQRAKTARARFPADNMWRAPSDGYAAIFDEVANIFYDRAAALISGLPVQPDSEPTDADAEGGVISGPAKEAK